MPDVFSQMQTSYVFLLVGVNGGQPCLCIPLGDLFLAQKFLLVCLLCLETRQMSNTGWGDDGGMEMGCHSLPWFVGAGG